MSSAPSLVAGLVAGAALGASACAAFLCYRQSAPAAPLATAAAAPPKAPSHSAHIFAEHCERTKLFFGDEHFARINSAFVVVVGLGGVGSMAAVAMARTGVRALRLIDPDMVTVSSLNRHAVATRRDVGKPKVLAMAEHIAEIVPEVAVEPIEAFFTASSAEQLLGGAPDLVLDCIDDTKTKVELLHHCHTRGIRVVSSFGVGACVDPSRIKALDISLTYACPLGRRIRKSLARLGVTRGIPCVFSTEVERRALAELSAEEHARLASQGISRQVRVRAVPSCMPLPAIAGLAVADVGLCVLAGLPHSFAGDALQQTRPESAAAAAEGAAEANVSESAAKRIIGDFVWRTSKRSGSAQSAAIGEALPVDQALFLIRDVWGGRSALSGRALKPKEMAFAVYDAARPVDRTNVILLSKDEAAEFETREEPLAPDAVGRIESVLATVHSDV